MLNKAAFSIAILIKTENKELADQMRSYNEACMPNFVAKPLERLRKDATNMPQKFWILVPHDKVQDHESHEKVHLINQRSKKPLSTKDSKIMWEPLSCIFEQLNVQSPLSKQQEENSRSSVLVYFHEVDEIVRNVSFHQTRWRKDSLAETEAYIRVDRNIYKKLADMLFKFMLPANDKLHDSVALFSLPLGVRDWLRLVIVASMDFPTILCRYLTQLRNDDRSSC